MVVVLVGAERGQGGAVGTGHVVVCWERVLREGKGWAEATGECQSSLGQNVTPSRGSLPTSTKSIKILGREKGR